MAYYAKISNNEFTLTEKERLVHATQEKRSIETANRSTAEYITLKAAYEDSFVNGSEADQQIALDNLNAKESEGTEDLVTEIDTLNTAIANALCRVTAIYTGADEFVSPSGEITETDNTVYWEGVYGGNPAFGKRTSYNTHGGVHSLGGTPFRKNYAALGGLYDPTRDAFYSEQPYASWTLDESTCYWQPPTPAPDARGWYWKEDTTEWVDYIYVNPDGNQPYPSWTWDTTAGGWNPPVEKPNDGEYVWNEDNGAWEPLGLIWIADLNKWVSPTYYNKYINQPYPSWTWDDSSEAWIPPVEKPPGPETVWDEENQTWNKLN